MPEHLAGNNDRIILAVQARGLGLSGVYLKSHCFSYVVNVGCQILHVTAKNKIYHLNTVFTRLSAAAHIKFFAPQVQRLTQGGAYLKILFYKEIFSFSLMAYLQSVRKNYS